MSPRNGPSRRTWVRVLAALGVAVLVGAVINQLRATAPHAELDVVVRAAEDPGSSSRDQVTCERRLPDVTRVEGSPTDRGPIGRVTSTAVTECPDRFDRRHVTFIGEVIGDVLRREGGAWVLMNDDAYALESGPLPSHQEFAGGNTGLAVWLPEDFVGAIEHAGGPGIRGTVLEVRGVIHRVDPADGGGLTLRARDAEVVAPATVIPEPVHTAQVVVALLAALTAIGMVVAERIVARAR